MKLKNLHKDAYDGLFCLLVLVLPHSLQLPNGLLILLSLLLVLDFKRWKEIDFRALRKPPILLLLMLVVYWYLIDTVTGNFLVNKHSLFVLILLVPALFLKVTNKHWIFISIVVSGFLIAANASIGLFSYYRGHHALLPFEGNEINQILRIERPYLGFISLISIILALRLARVYSRFRMLFYGYGIAMFFFIILISARISTISAVVVLLLYLWGHWKAALKVKLISAVGFLALAVVLINLNQNLKERLFITDNLSESFAKFKRHEPRFIIWPCAYDISQSESFNALTGLASEPKIDSLFAGCYAQKIDNKSRQDFFVASQLNSHNQFIGTYLYSGILGLSLLVLFFVVQLAVVRRDFVKTALTVSVVLFFFVENLFSRQLGVYWFALIVSMVNLYFEDRANNKLT